MGHALLRKPTIINDIPGQCTSIQGHVVDLQKGTCKCEKCGTAIHVCEIEKGGLVTPKITDKYGFDIISHYEKEYCPICGDYEQRLDSPAPAHGECDANNDCVCDFCGLSDHAPNDDGKEKILVLGSDGYNHHLGKFTCGKCGEIVQSEERPENCCHYYNDLDSDPPSTEDVANGRVSAGCYICGALYCASDIEHHHRLYYETLKNRPVVDWQNINDYLLNGVLHWDEGFTCAYCGNYVIPTFPTHKHTWRYAMNVEINDSEGPYLTSINYCEECGYCEDCGYADPETCSHNFETIESTETYTIVRCVNCGYEETYYW